jgi:hypothetical protein
VGAGCLVGQTAANSSQRPDAPFNPQDRPMKIWLAAIVFVLADTVVAADSIALQPLDVSHLVIQRDEESEGWKERLQGKEREWREVIP